MSNKEWKTFQQESTEWFTATRMGFFPHTNQTRLMGTVLESTLLNRSLIKLNEGRPQMSFFSAAEILAEALEQREPQLYPQVVQAWDFLRKYVTDSGRLNWDTEAACRASTREIYEAAEDCGISSAMRTPDAWASLVALMNMPEKKMESVVKKMDRENPMATNTLALCLPTVQMCDAVLNEEEAKQYRNKCMRRTKEASRQSRTPIQKANDSALLTGAPRASNLGCYCCGEFGHVKRECTQLRCAA